jgi:cation:H+ antiporter
VVTVRRIRALPSPRPRAYVRGRPASRAGSLCLEPLVELVPAAAAVLVGLVVLVLAADAFVVGAEGLALRLRWPPVVIGAVVVGFGTSLPELTTSVLAALAGEPDLALGNAAGSNVANLLLVLGIAVLVRPLRTPTSRREGRDTLIAVGAGFLLLAVAADGVIGVGQGVLLMATLAAAVAWQVRAGAGQRLEVAPAPTVAARRTLGVRLAVGLVGVIAGAQALVWGASTLATELGVPSIVIGSVLVAVGTSLPELATGVASARRGQADLLLGNLLGSNAFNALGVVGAAAVAGNLAGHPMEVASAALAVVAAAAVVTAAVGGIVWWRGAVGRVAATALVLLYAGSVPLLLAIS